MVDLSQCSDMPFRYKAGDTFNLAFIFSYEVVDVQFNLKVFSNNGTELYNFPDGDWVRDGKKKTLKKTPDEVVNLVKGKYRLKLIHTFSDGVVRTRFDSELTVY